MRWHTGKTENAHGNETKKHVGRKTHPTIKQKTLPKLANSRNNSKKDSAGAKNRPPVHLQT